MGWVLSGKLGFFNVSDESSAISTNWPSWIRLASFAGMGSIPPQCTWVLQGFLMADAWRGVG